MADKSILAKFSSAKAGIAIFGAGVAIFLCQLIPGIITRTFTWWMKVLFVVGLLLGAIGGRIMDKHLSAWMANIVRGGKRPG